MLQKRVQAGSCVVFDLDGTLVDTSADLLAAANACFAQMGAGAPLDAGDALTALRGGRAMLRLGFERLRGVTPEMAELDRWYPSLLQHYRGAIAVHSRPYPGLTDALETLRARGYLLTICTNKPAGLAETLMQELRLRAYFGALVGADTLPKPKPDPGPYRLAVEQAGGDVARSLIIGDTETDLKTARAVGRPAVLVSFGPEGAGVTRLGPDAVLHDYADLPALLETLLP